MAPARPTSRLAFEVAIICALAIEADAVKALFDQRWDSEPPHHDKAPGDPNAYSTGSIGSHNVVLTHLPGMGKVHAANAASSCRASFPNIKLALVVGICGAVPFVSTTGVEIILGDVILSNGIIQYDIGRQYPERFERKDMLLESLGRPSVEIRTILQKLGGVHDREKLSAKMVAYLDKLQKEPALQASYPGASHDTLFHATYRHPDAKKTCQECGCSGELVSRTRFKKEMVQPAVHFGLIASGDKVMKSGEERDEVAKREGVIGFEMEGAGIWDVFPCIVIKGVCDYADSHKMKLWQQYAAVTAAACTKAFLEYWISPAAGSYAQQSPSLSFTLPFSLSEVTEATHFVGRTQELIQMHSVLDKTHGRRVVVLHGLGGIGKTQLVVAYSKTYHTHYSAVIWLNAKDKTSLQQSFARAATRILRKYPALMYIKAAIESRDLPTIVQAVHQWLNESDNDRWLLVFDNYDNPKFETDEGMKVMASGSDQETDSQEKTMICPSFDIRPFSPDAYQGAIIVTTRSSTVEIGKMILLKKLTDVRESLDILSSASHRQIAEADEAAIELAKHLDGLPLALTTAGSYLNQVPVSWAEYLQLYRQSWLQLQESSPTLLSYENRALYSTWNISYVSIKQKSQAAAMMLHLWAYFDNEDMWYELLQQVKQEAPEWLKETVQDRISFHKVMRVLCDHGLVEADSRDWGVDSRGYSVHECVHSWMIHALVAQKDAIMVGLAVRCVASHTPTEEEPNYWLLQRRLLLHVDMCFIHISGKGSLVDVISEWCFHKFGFLYADQGRLKDAEAMYNRALQGYEKAWGPEHTSTLNTVNNLAALYANQGRLKDAEAMYNRALQGKEKAWGPEHTSTLDTVNNLAALYADQGRLKDAEAMYNRALQGKEKAWGPEHTSTLDTVNNLGLLYADQGRLKDAEAMYNRALQGYEKAWRPEHTSTLSTVNNLAILYADQGRLKDAEAMYNRALQGYEKAWGPEHTSTLDTVNNLGLLYANQGRLKDAEAMYNRALQGYEKAWGPEHTSTLDTVNNLGLLYANQGRLKDAEAMYNRALQGKEKAWGPEHTSTLNTVNNLGLLYANQGRLKDAEAMYNRALQGKEKAWGPEHTSTLNTVNNLGLLYANQGQLKDAEAMYNCALKGYEKAWGPEHTSTLSTVNNLGLLYADQGRLKDAEAMYNRVLQGYEKAWGPEHTSTLDTVNNLAILYINQGRLKEAEAMYNRALQGKEKAWGPEHTSTLDTVNNLAVLYANQGRLKDAEAMYNRALQGYEKTLRVPMVNTYPPALNTMENLGDLLQHVGRSEEAQKYYLRAEGGIQLVYGSGSRRCQRIVSKLNCSKE
ncbi:hypothetical protein S40293_09989 [Stachybotrys chartarum IBT 40293]|nr:hypothetical protein S40293_09989 [Stachybotrys chartarum IBT 40293]